MKRFYWENPETVEVEVELTQVDGCLCTVKPIVFHPDEGGQPPDKGMIGDAKIVKIDAKDGDAFITLDKPLSSGKYLAKIDLNHRILQSSRHTAQHIISGIAEVKMGLKTAGVRIGQTCTIDFDKKVDWEQLQQLEKMSNEIIMSDIPVLTEYGTLDGRGRFSEELANKDTSELRVVVIGDIDRSACCGTHVTSTGKIGSIRITNVEASRTGSRITFFAGQDAIDFGFAESSVLRNLRKTASCSNDELVGAYTKLSDQSSQLFKENMELWEKLIPIEISKSETFQSKFGQAHIVITAAPQKLHGKITSTLAIQTKELSLVFSSNGLNLVVSSPNGQAKAVFNSISEKTKVKGGGSDSSVNVLFESSISMEKIKQILG
jgi:alanyl-tRNA synthetase